MFAINKQLLCHPLKPGYIEFHSIRFDLIVDQITPAVELSCIYYDDLQNLTQIDIGALIDSQNGFAFSTAEPA